MRQSGDSGSKASPGSVLRPLPGPPGGRRGLGEPGSSPGSPGRPRRLLIQLDRIWIVGWGAVREALVLIRHTHFGQGPLSYGEGLIDIPHVPGALRALAGPVGVAGAPFVAAQGADIIDPPEGGVVPSAVPAPGADLRQFQLAFRPVVGAAHAVEDQVAGLPLPGVEPHFEGHDWLPFSSNIIHHVLLMGYIPSPTYSEFLPFFTPFLTYESEKIKWGGVPPLSLWKSTFLIFSIVLQHSLRNESRFDYI